MRITNFDIESWGIVISYSALAALLIYVVQALLLGKVFTKAKISYWKAWIPVVRDWAFFKAGAYKGSNIFWLIGAICVYAVGASCIWLDQNIAAYISFGISFALCVVYITFYVSAIISIQRKFSKPLPFLILYFINLIAPLWVWILALDNSKYNAKKGHQLKK